MLRWCVLDNLDANECHECCVSHCDENIHFATSFCWFFISMTIAVFLSDHNIPQSIPNEKLMVMMLDIIFFNV